mmetsp:Transcript_42902/g.68547  ORF Transcript_42902/g.68547 Transcript_42902/m.68547 type:complete len:566 (-) Transcript_42902:99-1796(-)
MVSSFIVALAAFSGLSLTRGSKKFLESDSSQRHANINNKAFRDDIINAMGPLLGCGGIADAKKVESVRNMLEPMWRTLPKMSSDRVDRRSLRYLVHRYFMKSSSLMIRGFEPTRSVNESHWGVADILSQMVPAYVESVFESHHAKQKGFDLTDAVDMVVVLEQLIYDSDGSLLARIYQDQRKPVQRSLSYTGLKQVLEHYLIDWMMEVDEEDMQLLLGNRSMMHEFVPHFDQLIKFLEGRIHALQHDRLQKLPKHRSKDMWEVKFSFQDAHEIIGGITQSFAAYWQSECDFMKLALVSMDAHNTGRVPLSKFYSEAINTDWRFGESEAYLRELGALDESSAYAGPQVIIPNYIQATSNCIISTPHYLVCCASECENLLGDIEAAIGTPTAEPQILLPLIGNMSAMTSVDEDDMPTLEGSLTEQLEQIANIHGGKVPLHGRLFAQWLHYAFPRECPFPHKIGMVSSVTPAQYGDEYIASNSDMRKHAANSTASNLPEVVSKDDLQWMSQWSPEEEFMVDYSAELGMSLERRLVLLIVGTALLVFGIGGGVVGCSTKSTGRKSSLLV